MKKAPERWQTEISATGVGYLLPWRQLGKVRHVGWMVAGMGLFGTLFMIGWMTMPIMEGVRLLKQQQWFGLTLIGFGLLGTLGLVPSMGMVVAGLAAIANRTRCTLAVHNGSLFTTERLFFFRWRRQCSIDQIQRLRIVAPSLRGGASRDISLGFGGFASALIAGRDGRKDFLIALGYSRELLAELAEELAPRLEAELDREGFYKSQSVVREHSDAAQAVEVVYEEGDGDDDRRELPHVPLKPIQSDATIERRKDGITLRLPPVGVWRGSKGLLVFCLVWNGIVGLFVVMLLLSLAGVVKIEGNSGSWMTLLVLIPFVVIGLAFLIATINMGRRHAVIATAFDSVMVIRHSVFGKRVRQWTTDQLVDICVGPSGMEVNDQPILELQIYPQAGTKFGLLCERQEDELRWIASELNQSLGMSTQTREHISAERDVSGNVMLPSGSNIRLEHIANGITIVVPPVGIRPWLSTIVSGVLCLVVCIGAAIGVIWWRVTGGAQAGDLAKWGFFGLFFLVFLGIGLGVLMGGLVAARRRFDIRVIHGRLTIDRFGPFGHRQFVWEDGDVQDVVVADSGTKVNGRELRQLKIVPNEGEALGLLTDRSSAELAAVATVLRDALVVPTNGANE